ncbi:hypothetical protein R69658_05960 [Paraburkholderia aspalathi]|uniref:Uncharacterized protein n=1 Tax=Paraburkholderia aspalathi TaxID=1324617 RepID=A0ABM8SP68_9BURK|nr:hypothetical protein [Paraburkholderia aspalathi]MBK3822232.1 hypothetical protein [Paraburkholderia aspalathi]MBK3834056.1 hypothetical protein [Paraburkholderia aspalathi]MBK3863804.1 hypothetical protein [Paraburkholderia aspalathi]CAE6823532.1 hypothetical protein R69658_05960 [Paraburkholderia aspalathi]
MRVMLARIFAAMTPVAIMSGCTQRSCVFLEPGRTVTMTSADLYGGTEICFARDGRRVHYSTRAVQSWAVTLDARGRVSLTPQSIIDEAAEQRLFDSMAR